MPHFFFICIKFFFLFELKTEQKIQIYILENTQCFEKMTGCLLFLV